MCAKPEWYPEDLKTRELLLEFFLKFARLEFVFKSSDVYAHLRKTRREVYWETKWSKVYKHYKKKSIPEGLAEILAYFKEVPVRVQISPKDFEPKFNSSEATEWEFLIRNLKNARNNLFHGGKGARLSERDVLIIKHSIQVIDCMVGLLPKGLQEVYSC